MSIKEDDLEMEGRPQARTVVAETPISDEEMQLILEMRKKAQAHTATTAVVPDAAPSVPATLVIEPVESAPPVRDPGMLIPVDHVETTSPDVVAEEPTVVSAPIEVEVAQPAPAATVSAPVPSEAPSAPKPEFEAPDVPQQKGEEEENKTIYRGFLCRIDPNSDYKPELAGLTQDSMLLAFPELGSFSIPPSFAKHEFGRMMIGSQVDPQTGEPKYIDEQQELTANIISAYSSNHAPSYINGEPAQTMAMQREGVTWDQRLKLGNGQEMSLIRSHAQQDTTLAGRIRKSKGGGAPITLYMPKSGFYVSYRIPKEREFCEFDIALVSETSKLGISSYGMLLSASSGIYMKHLLMHVMQYVTGTTLNMEGGDMATTILANLDMMDAGLFILGPIIAKYPHGLPWEIACPMESCGHTRQVHLNLARCVRPGNGLFTSEQLDFIVRTRGQLVTSKEVVEYRGVAAIPESHRYSATLPDGTHVTIVWGHSTALEYFDYSHEWIESNNTITNGALMQNSTEATRERHLRIVADQRRLLRHMHFIKSVELVDADGGSTVYDQRKEIVDALEELSEDRNYVNSFESALAKYIEDCRLFIVGYMVDTCPGCKRSDAGEKGDGPFRGMVSMSPDRIFFTLSRAVSGIQEQLSKVYDNIG
jgi:hypothetical protein